MEMEGASRQAFPDTRWSLVLRTRGASEDSRRALDVICQSYWRPLYAFARRSGKSPEEAEDLTQEFLLNLLKKETFQKVATDSGRLRTFLLGSFQNFQIDHYRRSHALKRGGGTTSFSLDTDGFELDLQGGTRDLSPAEVFERQWAFDLLDEAMNGLRSEYEKSGREDVFKALHPILHGGNITNYSDLGKQIGMREGAVKVAVHRLRQRFRSCLEKAVMETVDGENEVREELEFIRTVLSRG